ncbi:hypothetical protein A3D91_04310 [candidate division WWE3 bacterium RIFCSPHIGHO2_02_FULL_38_14]|uniref:Uncharacterized protein n=1 Tax=candidate division WWE3 bacterium RIFCSPHIGHO2_02_FULL_38_14 TaxID=1802620 RepID=A0A1F4V8U9_UNCKA|nr:MAG: hypothetical protein A3D91_04310 [candidate division WWE3 bacterium RIFCSPHIGHO2_02_FULL_38_14]
MPIKEVQVTNKQHAVPQNIMDVEFKLIGDLTMRQFAYLMVFGGLAWLCFSTLAGIFKFPLTLFFAILGLGLAFFSIADRGLDQWIVNFLRSMYSPTQMIWQRELNVPPIFLYQNLAVVKHELVTLAPTSSRRKLEEYLEYQNKTPKIDKLDIQEAEYIKKVRDAFMGETYITPAPSPYISVAVQEPQYYQPVQPAPHVKPVTEVIPEVGSEAKPGELKEAKEVKEEAAPPKPEAADIIKPSYITHPSAEQLTSEQLQIIKSAVPPSVPAGVIMPSISAFIPLTPITPDRRTGRMFTSLIPDRGEIILPVRGEKVLRTSEQQVMESDLESKTDQLKRLIDQIKRDEMYKNVISREGEEQEGSVKKQAQSVIEAIKQENTNLTKEIDKLKVDLEKSKQEGQVNVDTQEKIQKLEQEKSQLSVDYTKLKSTFNEFKDKEIKKPVAVEAQPYGTGAVSASYSTKQPLADRPNILLGTIKNNAGQSVEGAVIIIKNQKGESVRALKTNALGQFFISTPLMNGNYYIETDISKKTGLTFDIISVEVKGEIIAPLEIVGR